MTISSEQIRAGRALVRWTQEDLAHAAGISTPTLKRWEAGTGIPNGSARSLSALQKALETAGVVFIDENGGGAGVRLKR